MSLNTYLDDWVMSLAKSIIRYYLKNPQGRRFITGLVPVLIQSSGKRRRYAESGVQVPPFLVASITSACNLHCAGCYARAREGKRGSDMTTEEWRRIFQEASDIGVSGILLAGGEPMMRRDVIELAGGFSGIVFPMFTNATMMDDGYLEFFDEHRNVIPMLSVEGKRAETDLRRGEGISQKIASAGRELQARGVLYGVSITVTSMNLKEVTSDAFVAGMYEAGCGIIFYVAFVPAERGTEELVIGEAETAFLKGRVEDIRKRHPDIIVLSVPGDESALGGCLSAGRGFFHVSSTGNAEPCPFSPYSRQNLTSCSLLEVLQSQFFRDIQRISMRGDEVQYAGGCTLFAHEEEVSDVVARGDREAGKRV